MLHIEFYTGSKEGRLSGGFLHPGGWQVRARR
jgi:hypothetical protein